jgi:hypothetical protein
MPQDVPGLQVTLAKIEEFGIINEDTNKIAQRLELAVVNAAAQHQHGDLAIGDNAKKFLSALKAALHKELCDPEKKELKQNYNQLLAAGLTTNGVSTVAAVVTKIVATINPAFLVSSVVVYASIWLIKVGLNYWCSLPAAEAGK